MFSIKIEQRTIEDEDENLIVIDVVRVLYNGKGIALFKTTLAESVHDLMPKAREYLTTHGYLAEWTRQCNLGTQVNWSEDIRVDLNAN